MLKADSRWTHGLKTQDEHDQLIHSISAAQPVLKKLRTLILELAESKAKPKDSDYEKAAWPYWRADRDGYSKGLSDVLKLIPETE